MAAPGGRSMLGSFLKKQAKESEAAQTGNPKSAEGTQNGKDAKTGKSDDKSDSAKAAAPAAKPAKPNPTKLPEKLDDNETMDSSVARIVNFSDSDADEQPLKPRPAPELPPKRPPMTTDAKNAMLGKRVYDGVSGMGQWMKGTQAQAEVNSGQRGIQRIQRVWSHHGLPRLQQAQAGLNFTFVLKVLAIWLLKKHQPRVNRLLDLFCLAVPLGDAICSWQHKWPHVPGRLGEGLESAAQCSRDLCAPAIAAEAVSVVQRRLSARKRQTRKGPADADNGAKEDATQALDNGGSMQPVHHVNCGSSRESRRLYKVEEEVYSPGTVRQLDSLESMPPSRKVRKSRSLGGTPRDHSILQAPTMEITQEE